MEAIVKYFPDLSEVQRHQFELLKPLYQEWNEKINVISRKDLDAFYEHHVLHSLSIAKYFTPLPGMSVLDVGTGGGFPGIPLAIMFPQTSFLLVDSIGKKIKVVQAVADALGLQNVVAQQERVEKIKDKFDIITTRGVTDLRQLLAWTNNKLRIHNDIEAGGVFALKGGDIEEEIKAVPKNWKIKRKIISKWFSEDFFKEKYIIHCY